MKITVSHRYTIDETLLNCNQTLFGGEVLKWMDKVGHETAISITHKRMCTLAADSIKFLKPAFLGETIEVVGEPLELGPVKLKVQLTAIAEPEGPNRRVILTGIFTFVQLNDKLRPQRISYDSLTYLA